MPLYKIIIFKEPTPEEKKKGEDIRYQYGLLRAESHFQAEEKAKEEFQKTWMLQGWHWHGCFYEDDREIGSKVLWL